MISPLSNQNYYNPYNTIPAAQPVNNVSTAQQQSTVSPITTGTREVQKNQEIGPKECKTCKARKYKDQSSDASVSFQTPTHVSPDMAASAVATHEQEHVQNNEQKAQRDGMKATSFVQISTSVCPECGRIYVSGGTTTTYYSEKQKPQGEDGTGLFVNTKA
jgi:hypothetical protein